VAEGSGDQPEGTLRSAEQPGLGEHEAGGPHAEFLGTGDAVVCFLDDAPAQVDQDLGDVDPYRADLEAPAAQR
jgi:hypothetical protein